MHDSLGCLTNPYDINPPSRDHNPEIPVYVRPAVVRRRVVRDNCPKISEQACMAFVAGVMVGSTLMASYIAWVQRMEI